MTSSPSLLFSSPSSLPPLCVGTLQSCNAFCCFFCFPFYLLVFWACTLEGYGCFRFWRFMATICGPLVIRWLAVSACKSEETTPEARHARVDQSNE